jgi:hypothetical protein
MLMRAGWSTGTPRGGRSPPRRAELGAVLDGKRPQVRGRREVACRAEQLEELAQCGGVPVVWMTTVAHGCASHRRPCRTLQPARGLLEEPRVRAEPDEREEHHRRMRRFRSPTAAPSATAGPARCRGEAAPVAGGAIVRPMLTNGPVLRVITRLHIGGPVRQAMLLTDALYSRGFPSHLVHGSVSWSDGEFDLPPESRHYQDAPAAL